MNKIIYQVSDRNSRATVIAEYFSFKDAQAFIATKTKNNDLPDNFIINQVVRVSNPGKITAAEMINGEVTINFEQKVIKK